MTMSNHDAVQRREDARDRHTGEFGEHRHSEPEVSLEAGAEDDWAPQPQVYEMPVSRFDEARMRIMAANRRLVRAGISEQFEFDWEEYVHVPEGDVVGVAAVRLTLSTPRISLEGWTFAGAHEMTADGHIVNYGSTRVDEMRCDHCGHERRRGKVFTVQNEAGEVKVVGSNCMAAFLGVRPQGLWALTFDLERTENEEDAGGWGAAASTGDVTVPAVDLIGAALAASRDGEEFVPRSRATEKEPATADRVAGQLRAMVVAGEEPERRAQAEKILSWVNEQPEGGSDYIDNLRAVLAGKERWVGRKHFGIGVSAVSAYRNAQEWAIRDAQRKTEHASIYEPGHVGQVGERFRGRPMTVMVVDVMPGDMHGPKTRMVFRDDETGGQVIWWASGARREHEVGDKVRLTATVKEHGVYRDVDQTTISRGVVEAAG
jgi:hypothetical protein